MQWIVFYVIESFIILILSTIYIKKRKGNNKKNKKNAGQINLINNISKERKK